MFRGSMLHYACVYTYIYIYIARLLSQGPVLCGPVQRGGGESGGESEVPQERAPPFFLQGLMCGSEPGPGQAANRRRPRPAAAEQTKLETQLREENAQA